MLRSDTLPVFTFLAADGSEQSLALAQRAGRVRAIAARVAAALSGNAAGVPVGLMYASGPDLVLAWLGCVLAGAQPLVMQYPTRKQTRQYWEGSVTNTIGVTGLGLVLCDAHCAAMGLGRLVPTLEQNALDGMADADVTPFEIDDFAIIQLSSGTTGHRKAMRLTSAALLRHVTDFNATLGLDASDRIVSWLPLYHDMGYVACFVMPLLLGIPVVMMDPIDWVATPTLLWEAIERHAGTVCYMPNFGFEVMARAEPRATPTMRHWISCSEPVSPVTARRFLDATGTKEDRFAACYAMAENVFAVSLGRGVRTREIDGVEVISCGQPIPGVYLRVVDGQIWARSPASIARYLGGDDLRDADGFYPTGDLGELHADGLYVTGRRQDLLIQAGRKFMLSDIDLALGRLFPDIRGRAAALAREDARLGTQVAVMLIEAGDFFERTDQGAIADALRDATGLDQIEVAFVPPRFLTKTSSGKINRRITAAHWAGVQAHRGALLGEIDPVAELRASFPRVDRTLAVGQILNSLSLTVLRIILGDAGLAYDPDATLAGIEAQLASGIGRSADASEPGLRIVSLADRRTVSKLTEADLDRLAADLGCPVTFEHVCLPPSPILLSDLVFDDYFSPRLEQSALGSMRAALAKLRGASLILVDDTAEMQMPPNQAYAPLSHNLERDPRSDLIIVRWQSYPRQHHLLPTTFVAGRDLPLEGRQTTLRQLAAYLGRPMFRIASSPTLSRYTADWDYLALPGTPDAALSTGVVQPDRLVAALSAWLRARPERLVLSPLPRGPRLDLNDLGHFCSHFGHQPHIDVMLQRFDSFCIAGQAASIPYIRDTLTRMGKRFTLVPSYAPEILATVAEPYDCLLICGAWGDYPITTPAGAVMFINYGSASTYNIDDPLLTRLRFKRNARHDPPSATDWFHTGELHRDWDMSLWAADRAEKARPRDEAPIAGAAPVRRTVRELLDEAIQARGHGRLEEARALAEQAVCIKPDNAMAYRLLCDIAADRGDPQTLREEVARATARMPEQKDVFARLEESRLRRMKSVLS